MFKCGSPMGDRERSWNAEMITPPGRVGPEVTDIHVEYVPGFRQPKSLCMVDARIVTR